MSKLFYSEIVASLSDLAQGDSRGPGAAQGAGRAGAGRNSARGCKCTRGDGEAADKKSLDTACRTHKHINITFLKVLPHERENRQLWRSNNIVFSKPRVFIDDWLLFEYFYITANNLYRNSEWELPPYHVLSKLV